MRFFASSQGEATQKSKVGSTSFSVAPLYVPILYLTVAILITKINELLVFMQFGELLLKIKPQPLKVPCGVVKH